MHRRLYGSVRFHFSIFTADLIRRSWRPAFIVKIRPSTAESRG